MSQKEIDLVFKEKNIKKRRKLITKLLKKNKNNNIMSQELYLTIFTT